MFSSLSLVHLSMIFLVATAWLSLFFLIYAIRRFRRQEVFPEWLEAKQYADIKGLGQDHWLILNSMLKRYAADNPLETVMERPEFDRCIRAQLNAIPDFAQREKMGETLREIRKAFDLLILSAGSRFSSTLDIEEMQTVSARLLDHEDSPMHEFHVNRVNDAFFYVTPKTSESFPSISKGSRFRLHVSRPGDGHYAVTCEAADLRENPLTIVFNHVFDVKRLEARAHERSAYTLPTPLDMFLVPEDHAEDPLPWLYDNAPASQGQATFMNLSAGGYAAMLLAAPPPNRAYARVTITLGREDFPPFTVFSRIVGTVALAENRTLIRATFADITPKQQESIEQYVQQALQMEQGMYDTGKGPDTSDEPSA